jgi:asparagine synthase (glutamine-hydrolysing)
MCGIAGVLDPGGVSVAEVQRMADALAHRGPDDATMHVESGLGFGFRRLSIIDLVTGRQPIANEDETIHVILNGEIYNYRDLRAELTARGHVFRTQSDTEVLVHLYEEYGSDLVKELRGMYGFALWDRRSRRLLLARDHLGQKPLYWAQRDGRLYFGSEIKAILAAEPRFRELNPIALDEYLTLRIIVDPRSMFAGVNKLPPGHVLEARDGKVKTWRYWDLSYEPKHPLSESDALAELDEVVRDTVRLHLVSDVPAGAFLSGGVDSSLVTAIMRQVSGEPFKTFSISVPYGAYDEAPKARTVAERFGTDHYEGSVDGNLIRLLPTLVYHLDEPSDHLSACVFRLAEMTAQEVKVALGGDGGDELFGGYDRYYGTRYARYYAALPARGVIRRVLDRAPDGFWYKSLTHRLRWLHELSEVSGSRRYARCLSYFYFTPRYRADLYTDHFRSLVSGFDAEESIIAWHDDDRVKEQLDRMLLADSMIREPNHPVMILDRMTMAHGLEARSPFLDHRLAEYTATLPTCLKVRGRQRRYLQMRLAERYLPREVLQKPKQGMSSGLPYMMAGQFRALFKHFLKSAHLVETGYLRRPVIENMLDLHLAGRADHGNRLWLLLNAEVWHRMHLEGVPVEDMHEEVDSVLGIQTSRRTHDMVRAS